MGLDPVQTCLADWRRRLPYRRYLDLEDRPRRLAAQNLSLLTLILGALYLAWLGPLMWHAPGDQSILFFLAETLAYLDILKTDAVEAEYLTGKTDIYEAAKAFAEMGPAEIVLTHKEGVLVYADGKFGSFRVYAGFWSS